MALYRDKAMDYFPNPWNIGVIEDSCGIGVRLVILCAATLQRSKIAHNIITGVTSEPFGRGSAIASRSMETECIRGKPLSDPLPLSAKRWTDFRIINSIALYWQRRL